MENQVTELYATRVVEYDEAAKLEAYFKEDEMEQDLRGKDNE